MPAPVVIVGTNSWASIAQADDYFLAKWGGDAWATLSVSQKTQLLVSAFNWISQQSGLSVSPSDSTSLVRSAQLEAAWFLYKYADEHEKRRALTSMGVKSYRVMDFSETLEDCAFPEFISSMLSAYATGSGGVVVEVDRDLSENQSQ